MRIDVWALVILALLGLLYAFIRKRSQTYVQPYVNFPKLEDFGLQSPGWRAKLHRLPLYLLYGALIAFALAFVDIHWVRLPGADPFTPPQTPQEGIAIYILVDRSGSMKDAALETDSRGYLVKTPKIDILKRVTTEFVQGDPKTGLTGRPNDLIGLVAFARTADVLVPLTLNHKEVLESLNNLRITDDEDSQGTGIGYAVYKTASVISATRHFADEEALRGKPPYEIKSAIMVLVTDGFQDVNPQDRGRRYRSMDVEEATNFAKEQGVKLYIINVDPSLNSDEFQPHRNQMRRVAENTGGRFYITDQGRSLEKIYADINQLEKSSLPDFDAQKRILTPVRTASLYPFFIAVGLLMLAGSIFLQTTWLRQIP